MELLTYSSTVHRWITDALTGRSRLKTKAMSEMLIRWRIDIVTSMVEEYAIKLSVTLVQSSSNKADRLTQVPQRWSAAHDRHPPPVPSTSVSASQSSHLVCAAATEVN